LGEGVVEYDRRSVPFWARDVRFSGILATDLMSDWFLKSSLFGGEQKKKKSPTGHTIHSQRHFQQQADP
jgi:hypothetical protein